MNQSSRSKRRRTEVELNTGTSKRAPELGFRGEFVKQNQKVYEELQVESTPLIIATKIRRHGSTRRRNDEKRKRPPLNGRRNKKRNPLLPPYWINSGDLWGEKERSHVCCILIKREEKNK